MSLAQQLHCGNLRFRSIQKLGADILEQEVPGPPSNWHLCGSLLQVGLQDIFTHLRGYVQHIPGRLPQRHSKLCNIKWGQPPSSGSRWPSAHLWLLQLLEETIFPPSSGGQHWIFVIQGQLSLLLPKNKKTVSLWHQQPLQVSCCVQPKKLRQLECKGIVTE